jgi:apolipoprotein N-acyltransferase
MLKNLGWVLATGVLLSIAWPVNGIPIVLFIALIPLLALNEKISGDAYRAKGLRLFFYHWLSFLIWNALTTWWIWNSTPDGAIIAIVCNSMFMAFVMTMFFQIKKAFGSKQGYIGLLFCWIGFEYVHMDWDLSWPWLMLGNGFAAWYPLVQWYAWVGVLGGTLWIWLANIILWEFAIKQWRNQKPIRPMPVLGVIILPMALSLTLYYTYEEQGETLHVGAIQPNLDPYLEKYRIDPYEQVNAMLEQCSEIMRKQPETRVIVFPETSVPTGIWEHEALSHPLIQEVAKWTDRYPKAELIMGVYSFRFLSEEEKVPASANKGASGRWYDDHNAAMWLHTSGEHQFYHKSKLVPGPEILPFAEWLKPFQSQMFGNLGGMIGNMGKQKYRTVFPLIESPGVAAPVICYESIYGDFVAGYVRKGANFLAVLTNDAWWGNTPGHKQLLAYTRLRAIETRRSIVRSANTGISCLINQRGDLISPVPYLDKGTVAGEIKLNNSLTIYVKTGDFWGGIFALFGIMLYLYSLVFSKLHRK